MVSRGSARTRRSVHSSRLTPKVLSIHTQSGSETKSSWSAAGSQPSSVRRSRSSSTKPPSAPATRYRLSRCGSAPARNRTRGDQSGRRLRRQHLHPGLSSGPQQGAEGESRRRPNCVGPPEGGSSSSRSVPLPRPITLGFLEGEYSEVRLGKVVRIVYFTQTGCSQRRCHVVARSRARGLELNPVSVF